MFKTVATICLLLIVAPAHAANCIVPTFRILDHQTVNGTMYATSGKPCGVILVATLGPARIITQPSNGRASIQGPRIVHISRPGYVGDDRFTYARSGTDGHSQPITRTVEMSVKVADHW